MTGRDTISDDDRALFRRAAGDVRRIEDDRATVHRPRPSARPRTTATRDVDDSGLVESDWTPELEPGDVMSFARPGVRRREMARLRRGRIRVEADLDLHGRRTADAVTALGQFLDDCRRQGQRCVRVVHGKGFGSRQGRPIMKAHVDRWLRERPEVLAFCSAIPPDGGTGAVYVLLSSHR